MSSSEAFLEPAEFVSQQAFLKRLARGILGDDALAEDVVQDAWLAWIKNKDRVQSSPSWLAQTVRNLSSNARREQARRNARERLVARDERVDLTEDDLELAQFVLAALRALDEPLKSTLVLRYLNDLTPKQVAERQRLPIDTVKARLKRGLAALRAALDRRHDGDARAWAPLLARFAGREHGGATGASTLAGSTWSSVVQIALACAALLATLLFVLTLRKGGLEPAHSMAALASAPVKVDLAPPAQSEQREPIVSKSKFAAKPAPAVPATTSGPAPFDWPQYAGGPAHDNLRKRASSIVVPRIAWHVPGALGQPTMLGTTLYSGGKSLMRIRASDGAIEARFEPVDVGNSGRPPKFTKIGAAPLLTGSSVIARDFAGNAIVSLHPRLTHELWRFEPAGNVMAALMPGLLVGKSAIYTLGAEIIALQARSGALLWRFPIKDDAVTLVPVSDGARVFFATEHGKVYALDLASGAELWHVQQPAQFGWTQPVVVQARVLLADRGGRREDPDYNTRGGSVHAFSTETGEELWSQEFDATGFSTPGIGAKFFVAGFGRSVARFDFASGKRIEPTVKTGVNAFGSPTVVGDELVFGNLDGHLYVHDLKLGSLRWSFHVPDAQVNDFVHTGERIYVSTTRGLFALENNPSAKPSNGFVLEAPADNSGLDDVSQGREDQR